MVYPFSTHISTFFSLDIFSFLFFLTQFSLQDEYYTTYNIDITKTYIIGKKYLKCYPNICLD